LLPFRQQAVRINLRANVVVDALESQTTLQRTVAPRVEHIGTPADVITADEDLRDGLCAGASCKHSANLSTEIILLVLDGIQIDAAVLDTDAREEFPYRPAEFTPFEREQHDRVSADEIIDKSLRVSVCLHWSRLRRLWRRRWRIKTTRRG